jgi:ABC-type nitrate/sulfonate/bicarbonate transport system substrate-binding protein/outer membrane protein OmpA-like peptidoglycan-associated protein
MLSRARFLTLVLILLGLIAASAHAQGTFVEQVGPVSVGPVSQMNPLTVPYITWGGDMATFYANGGKRTQPNTIFQKQGLNLSLVPGDDFIQQVRDYMSGKSPFLRGTFRMMGMASELIGSDPRTKGVVIMQMTWSAGDHCVARAELRTITDLKGRTIALQRGGPHVGMLDDILKSAKLDWNDVKIVWAKDLTGSEQSPAELFRKQANIDACFVISPDMIGLTGGPQSVGTGAEGTVKGARILVSTAELSRSIADVYVCRKDFFDAHKETVLRFVAGYFKATEEVAELKKKYETAGSKEYTALLQLTQDIYGKEVIPTLEEDAHGLLSDCVLVGYPGNVVFFTQKNNLNGFGAFQNSALDLAVRQGYAKVKTGFFEPGFDYNSTVFTKYLARTQVDQRERFRAEAVLSEIEEMSRGDLLDDRTIVSFTINFEPNQAEFSSVQYGAEYQRVAEMAAKYGNAVFAIRGHADPTLTLRNFVRAGMQKGILKSAGTTENRTYSLKGRPLKIEDTKEVVKMIEAGDFDGVAEFNPRETMQAALNLSRQRAEAVRDSIIQYAKTQGINLDASQIQPIGVGIGEPFIAKPSTPDEARQNMRVEFRLLRVSAEATTKSDFDF